VPKEEEEEEEGQEKGNREEIQTVHERAGRARIPPTRNGKKR